MPKFFAILAVVTISLLSTAICSPAQAEESPALTLVDAYRLALQQSESIQRKAEDVRAAEARYKEALSAIYPQIHAGATQRLRDGSSSGGSDSSVNIAENGSASPSKHPFQTSLTLTQPIFTGFRDFYLIEASGFEINASRFDQQRSAELLYSDVADIYLQSIYYSAALKIFDKTNRVLSQRITDLKRFIDLGKSRLSEIEAAEAELADLGAVKAQTAGLLSATNEMLAFLVGRPAAELKLVKSPPLAAPAPLDDLITKARGRADLKANAERVLGAGKEVVASERERWPVISLSGSAYPYSDPDEDRDWDLLLKMDLPIFEGGAIDARIAQSQSKERSAQLTAQEAARIAEREVRISYSDVQAGRQEADRLRNLLGATRKNYDSQRHDYELGVVTNLDVLAAIRDVQNAERRLLEAETRVQRNQIKLQVAAGELP